MILKAHEDERKTLRSPLGYDECRIALSDAAGGKTGGREKITNDWNGRHTAHRTGGQLLGQLGLIQQNQPLSVQKNQSHAAPRQRAGCIAMNIADIIIVLPV